VITRLTDPTRGVTAGRGSISASQLKINIVNEKIAFLSWTKFKTSRHIHVELIK
jgi:hypothetical protein